MDTNITENRQLDRANGGTPARMVNWAEVHIGRAAWECARPNETTVRGMGNPTNDEQCKLPNSEGICDVGQHKDRARA